MPDLPPRPIPASSSHRAPDSPSVPASPHPPISPSAPLRILLVDDHGLFAEGLQNLLQAGGYPVIGVASDGLEALQVARALRPDLILMDIRMPNCNGLEATRLLQAELPEIQIVMLTTSAEDADLFEALKCGASGYLLKNLKPNELFDYLEGLARGEAPLSPELSARLLREFTRVATTLDEHNRVLEKQPPPDGSSSQNRQKTDGSPGAEGEASRPSPEVELTPRQRQILEMIANGSSYKEVGNALHVSENTVKYHMGKILQRLHAKNRAQVMAYILHDQQKK
jgi:DNA-binding NarL/FixJ family response regulator